MNAVILIKIGPKYFFLSFPAIVSFGGGDAVRSCKRAEKSSLEHLWKAWNLPVHTLPEMIFQKQTGHKET